MVFDFLQTGLSSKYFSLFLLLQWFDIDSLGWMESVYTVLGEMSLYFLVLVISVMFWTMYYADLSNQTLEGQVSDAPVMNNNEL